MFSYVGKPNARNLPLVIIHPCVLYLAAFGPFLARCWQLYSAMMGHSQECCCIYWYQPISILRYGHIPLVWIWSFSGQYQDYQHGWDRYNIPYTSIYHLLTVAQMGGDHRVRPNWFVKLGAANQKKLLSRRDILSSHKQFRYYFDDVPFENETSLVIWTVAKHSHLWSHLYVVLSTIKLWFLVFHVRIWLVSWIIAAIIA